MPLNFGHRGLKGLFPENTMVAFKRAVEFGADGIELDVQLTKDKEVVVFHDFTIDRMTEGEGKVEDFTIEELKRFSIVSPLQEGLLPQTIPSFKEYVEWAKNQDIVTNVELKAETGDNNGLEEKVYEELKASNLVDQVIISSFQLECVLRMKDIAPEIQTALLSVHYDEKVMDMIKQLNIDYAHPRYTSLTEELVEQSNEREIKINAWTVNKLDDLEKMIQLKVNAVITDFPDRLEALETESTEDTVGNE